MCSRYQQRVEGKGRDGGKNATGRSKIKVSLPEGWRAMDFSRMRATDIKQNKRIFLPKDLEQELEAKMEVRRMEGSKFFDECMKILQDEESVKTEDNLTPSERRGLDSLRKRVKEGKIVLVQTDKSWRLAVLTREQYQETGEPHLKDTTEIGPGFLRTNQSILNGHMSWWAAILNLGAN